MKHLILKDATEIIKYNNPDIPLYIQQQKLSTYTNMQALCHWHDDIEFIRILSGSMNYYVGGQKIQIDENDGLFVNTRQLHYGYSVNHNECEFICILFHPQLLFSNAGLMQKYFTPIADNTGLSYFYLSSGQEKHREILNRLDQITAAQKQKSDGFELAELAHLHHLWMNLCLILKPSDHIVFSASDKDAAIQKRMVDFIHQHYATKLTLEQIAGAGGVCRSRCCEIFKKHLNRSPIDFLNTYRLEVSMQLLKETAMNITDIGSTCGFGSPSYFSEMFMHYKGCSPSGYRSRHKEPVIHRQ